MPVDDTDPREAERPRGALTQSDREYLLHGEVGGSKSAESVKRHRIRERIRQSIFDLSLAFQEMSQEDASQVFDLPVGEKQQLEDSISDAFAFLYLGTGAHFQDSVQQGLERAVDQYAHFSVDGIEVSIDVYEDEATSLDRAIEMLENPESIPEKTLKTMRVRVDEVPPDEQLQRLMNLDTDLADALLGGLLPVSELGSLPDTGEYIVVPGRLLKHTDQHPELPI